MRHKTMQRVIALLLSMIMICAVGVVSAAAFAPFRIGAKSNNIHMNEDTNSEAMISVSAPSMSIVKGQKITMQAEVTGVSVSDLKWSSSDPRVATIDENGVVTGKNVGRTLITASCEQNGTVVHGDFMLYVVTQKNAIKDLLESRQILSYKYSYKDDYYYTDNHANWQKNFGFEKLYDLVAPYVGMEYDYVRVFFPYDGKDWMIQLWKGQYGPVFYGCEVGVYNKEHSDKADTVLTNYACAKEDDWLDMEMSLYHDKGNGEYQREFTADYDSYWWCTGFKPGHLRQQEPATELRQVSRITFKDAEMTRLFVEGFEKCGFKQVASKEQVGLDEFAVEGNDVYYTWQNISDAENTMPIKTTIWTMIIVYIIVAALTMMGVLGLGSLLFLILI